MITPKDINQIPENPKDLRYALVRFWREMVEKANYHLIQWRLSGTDTGGKGQVNTVNFTGAGVSTSIADSVLTVTVSGGGGGNFVEAEVDFGSGKSDASVVITGQAGILTSSKVNAWIYPKATTDHTADEHWLETISVCAGNIVAGTGFTIYAKNTNMINEPVENYNRGGKGGKGTLLYGKYTVQASWG